MSRPAVVPAARAHGLRKAGAMRAAEATTNPLDGAVHPSVRTAPLARIGGKGQHHGTHNVEDAQGASG